MWHYNVKSSGVVNAASNPFAITIKGSGGYELIPILPLTQ